MIGTQPGQLVLLVIGEHVTTHRLPKAGTLTLGAAPACDVRVEDSSVAPVHAHLHVAEQLTLEDAATGRPTRVVDALLEPGERRVLRPGEHLTLGTALLVLQRKASVEAPPRRIWTYGYFESRLEEECLRAERFDSEFAVIHVRALEAKDTAAVELLLANELRLVDVVGAYGPGEYEVLLPDTLAANVDLVIERLSTAFAARAPRVRLGVAKYPNEGRSPAELSARARANARGEALEPRVETAVPGRGAMQQLGKLVERIANGVISVLVLGETGVGKERLAERIHQLSPRAKGPFLRLNCAALSESLLESELFGHEKGAFTGAVQAKKGLLETAHGGTVFFDEVGELPLSMQVKLLRVIEERQATRVGGLRPYSIDVRFVSATNRDLELEIAKAAFREDLYFRLNGITLVIPPLRERVEEIQGLAEAFIADTCRRGNRDGAPRLSPRALALLEGYGWPGNIRELRNVIERAVLLCSDQTITPEHLPVERLTTTFAPRRPGGFGLTRPALPPPELARPVAGAPGEAGSTLPVFGAEPSGDATPMVHGARREREAYERRRILEALSSCAGNQSEAAKLLGVSRRTLVKRLDAYGLPRPRKGRH